MMKMPHLGPKHRTEVCVHVQVLWLFQTRRRGSERSNDLSTVLLQARCKITDKNNTQGML
ncbi:hypothetical protein FRC03_008020, partial [Tulasnella sp. 419]